MKLILHLGTYSNCNWLGEKVDVVQNQVKRQLLKRKDLDLRVKICLLNIFLLGKTKKHQKRVFWSYKVYIGTLKSLWFNGLVLNVCSIILSLPISAVAINYETLNFIFDSITTHFMIMVTKIVFFIRFGHKMSQLLNIQMLILLQTSSCEQISLQQIEKILN